MKTRRERHPNMRPATLNFDRYAWAMLEELVPNRKAFGSFLTALIYAEHARRKERVQGQEEQGAGGGQMLEESHVPAKQ